MRKGRSYPVPALVVDVGSPQCLIVRIAVGLITGTARSKVIGGVLCLSPIYALAIRNSPSNPVQRLRVGKILGPAKRVVRKHRVFDDLSVCKGREGTHLPTFARKAGQDHYLWCYASPTSSPSKEESYNQKGSRDSYHESGR